MSDSNNPSKVINGDDCETGNCAPAQSATKTAERLDNLTNWEEFIPPIKSANAFGDELLPSIVIEYCNRCRWQHRATWVQTELFITFEDKQQQSSDQTQTKSEGKYASSVGLKSIQLIPCNRPETGGRFRVWLYRNHNEAITNAKDGKGAIGTFEDGKIVLLWDRKIRDGFPELKELVSSIITICCISTLSNTLFCCCRSRLFVIKSLLDIILAIQIEKKKHNCSKIEIRI